MRPSLTFLCRGSATVGLGHVMRSRSVAASAAAHAEVRLIVIGDPSAFALVSGCNHRVQCVESDAEASAALQAESSQVIFFDLTDFDERSFRRAAEHSMTVSLSPLFTHLALCDRVYHRTSRHPEAVGSAAARWRMGPKYAVIRPGIERIDEASYGASITEPSMLSVAICMGGGDAANRTLAVLERLRRIDTRMLFWVLLGEGYGYSFDALIQTVRRDRHHEIILARTTDSMWRVMRGCAVAVLASGTVTFEAAAAGLPSLNLIERSNQRFLLEGLLACGAAEDFEGPDAVDAVARRLEVLDQDRSLLLHMHRASQGLLDGLGAERIVLDVLDELRGARDAVIDVRTRAGKASLC